MQLIMQALAHSKGRLGSTTVRRTSGSRHLVDTDAIYYYIAPEKCMASGICSAKVSFDKLIAASRANRAVAQRQVVHLGASDRV